MQKLFDYVNETGSMPKLGRIEAPKQQFKNRSKKYLKLRWNMKKFTILKINELVEITLLIKTILTFNF